MTEDEKIQRLLDAQEHPENYSDKEINELLKEAEPLSDLKRAMTDEDTRKEDIDVNAAWERFGQKHAKEDQLPSHAWLKVAWLNHAWLKIAASFIGFLIVGAAAYAAMVSLGLVRNPFHQTTSAKTEIIAKQDTAKIAKPIVATKDTVTTKKEAPQTIHFDNAELTTILGAMAKYYGVEVNFANEAAKHIRLHFEWDQAKSLDDNIQVLNSFQQITITRDGNKIVVE